MDRVCRKAMRIPCYRMLVENKRGYYSFLKGIAPYWAGVVAEAGFEVVHVRVAGATFLCVAPNQAVEAHLKRSWHSRSTGDVLQLPCYCLKPFTVLPASISSSTKFTPISTRSDTFSLTGKKPQPAVKNISDCGWGPQKCPHFNASLRTKPSKARAEDVSGCGQQANRLKVCLIRMSVRRGRVRGLLRLKRSGTSLYGTDGREISRTQGWAGTMSL